MNRAIQFQLLTWSTKSIRNYQLPMPNNQN